MAFNKKAYFSDTSQELAGYARVLAHPARIEILRFLARQQDCICGDVVETLPLAQSTVSQHLKEMTQAGLIQVRSDGIKSYYCIDKKKFENFVTLISKFCTNIKEDNERCC